MFPVNDMVGQFSSRHLIGYEDLDNFGSERVKILVPNLAPVF